MFLLGENQFFLCKNKCFFLEKINVSFRKNKFRLGGNQFFLLGGNQFFLLGENRFFF